MPSELVELLGFPITSSKFFGVSLGTRDSIQEEGECIFVVLELRGTMVVENHLLLQLCNSDVILGIRWLVKLGTMITDWKMRTLKFQLGG